MGRLTWVTGSRLWRSWKQSVLPWLSPPECAARAVESARCQDDQEEDHRDGRGVGDILLAEALLHHLEDVTVVVAPFGPPLVITNTWVNSWKAAMVMVMMMNTQYVAQPRQGYKAELLPGTGTVEARRPRIDPPGCPAARPGTAPSGSRLLARPT